MSMLHFLRPLLLSVSALLFVAPLALADTTQTTLSASLTGHASVVQGHHVMYMVTVQNTGNVAAQNVKVTLVQTDGLEFVASKSDGRCGLPMFQRCVVSSLAAHKTVHFVLIYATSIHSPCSEKELAKSATVTWDNGGMLQLPAVQTRMTCR